MSNPEDIQYQILTCNTLRASTAKDEERNAAEGSLNQQFDTKKTLAVYGSLMPGKENHHVVAHIAGFWHTGYIKGYFEDGGWSMGTGYPSIIWDPAGVSIPVSVLVSDYLPQHWSRLDYFEGDAYQRILIPVYQGKEVKWVANIYESATKNFL